MIDSDEFRGMDRTELLMAIAEVHPGVHFPENATREDLINYLPGRIPDLPDDDRDDDWTAGVRSPRPRTPLHRLSAQVKPEG